MEVYVDGNRIFAAGYDDTNVPIIVEYDTSLNLVAQRTITGGGRWMSIQKHNGVITLVGNTIDAAIHEPTVLEIGGDGVTDLSVLSGTIDGRVFADPGLTHSTSAFTDAAWSPTEAANTTGVSLQTATISNATTTVSKSTF